MNKYIKIIIGLNLVILLIFFNYSVYEKEQLLKNSKLVLLKLRPKDPRSLIQGDYMNLRYQICETGFDYDSIPKSGCFIVSLDSHGVAALKRIQKNADNLKEGEIPLKYSAQLYPIKIGAESYFFQEGTAKKYEKTWYGGIKVDAKGNSVLIGLYDSAYQLIK